MGPLKIGFVLLSSSSAPIPSTRIAALNMFPFLRAANFDPRIVFEPRNPTETPDLSALETKLLSQALDVVVFQKVHGPSVEAVARLLTREGVKTVYSVCDLVDCGMAAATDATITVTEYLKALYPPELRSKIHVVHDGIEHPEIVKTAWRDERGSRARPLRAVLVTSENLAHLPVFDTPPDWLEVTIVGRYPAAESFAGRLRRLRWRLSELDARGKLKHLRFLADRRIRCMPWDPNGVYEALRSCDIGIIPIDSAARPESSPDPSAWKLKSENRLTLKMAVGLPVIASPIPAYEAVIQQAKNGFLARSRREWLDCLEFLRDPTARHEMGNVARESVLTRFSMEEQARRLIAVLQALGAPAARAQAKA